jgi:hypothetical protein
VAFVLSMRHRGAPAIVTVLAAAGAGCDLLTADTASRASPPDRPFVKVPRALKVTETKGEPATIALRKRPDGVIEVTALQ